MRETAMSVQRLRSVPLLLIAGLGFTACAPDTTDQPVLQKTTLNSHPVTEIDIGAIPDEVTQIGFSDFFADFNVIRLESSVEALASNATIQFADDFILLGTQHFPGAARLLRFNYEGNYLNTIGREGEGPGEHRGQYISTLEFYKESNTVLVSWGALENRQLFRPDGTHLRDIKVPMRLLENIARWSEDEWFSYGSTTGRSRYPRDSVKIVFYTSDGEITKRINRTNYPPRNTTEYTPTGSASLFSVGGTRKIYFPGDHTIYRIEDRELVPEAVIRPGENIVPFNELTAPDNIIGSYSLKILSETDRNWFIKKSIYTEADFEEFENQPGRWGGRYDTREQLLVIDKETNKGKMYAFTDDLLYIFPDELSKNILPWQEGYGAYIALSPDMYIKFTEASKKLDQRSPEVARKLEVVDGISMDDNFIIFIFRFREEIEIN